MTGVGSYLPKNKYSNEDLTKFIDTSDEWITKRSGIKFRHFVSENETTSDMAVNAALNAIINAQIKKEVIDLIIVATTTPDNTFPATATLVQKKLGINSVSFDFLGAKILLMICFFSTRGAGITLISFFFAPIIPLSEGYLG